MMNDNILAAKLVKGMSFDAANDEAEFASMIAFCDGIQDDVAAFDAVRNHFNSARVNELCGNEDSVTVNYRIGVVDGETVVEEL